MFDASFPHGHTGRRGGKSDDDSAFAPNDVLTGMRPDLRSVSQAKRIAQGPELDRRASGRHAVLPEGKAR
jgi:hypothetical protein